MPIFKPRWRLREIPEHIRPYVLKQTVRRAYKATTAGYKCNKITYSAYIHGPVKHRRPAWRCIYRHEKGSQGWRTNTGNGYYGGLQMDLSFQRSYGSYLLNRKGTANNWKFWEQILVADRAYRSGRGFYPWPNTARYCGVL